MLSLRRGLRGDSRTKVRDAGTFPRLKISRNYRTCTLPVNPGLIPLLIFATLNFVVEVLGVPERTRAGLRLLCLPVGNGLRRRAEFLFSPGEMDTVSWPRRRTGFGLGARGKRAPRLRPP